MIKLFLTAACICANVLLIPISQAATNNKCAVLLHGLGRTHLSMSSLEKLLNHEGFYVVSHTYPSTQKDIDTLALEYIPPMLDACKAKGKTEIVIITHSLGGIVAQAYLTQHDIPELTHLIMLSPPNHGSPIVDKLHRYWLFQHLLGPAFQALKTQGLPYTHPAEKSYRICILAGSKPQPLLSRYFFGNMPNDGKVSITSTYLDSADEFVVYPVNHTFIMNHVLVHEKIRSFLRTRSTIK